MSVNLNARVKGHKNPVTIASADATLAYSEEFGEATGISKASNTSRLNKLRNQARGILQAGQGFKGTESHESYSGKGEKGDEYENWSTLSVKADASFLTVTFVDGGSEHMVPASAVESFSLEDDGNMPVAVEADEEEAEEADEDDE